MVEQLQNANCIYVKCTIVPQLQKHNEISLKRGDTLVVHVPFDEFDCEKINTFYEMFSKAFPYNQIIVTDTEVTLEVIKDDK